MRHQHKKLAVTLCLMVAAVPLVFSPQISHGQEQQHLSPQQLFAMPSANDRVRSVISALSRRQIDGALKSLEKITATYPWHMDSQYLYASVLAVKGHKEEALDALQMAIDNGFDNRQILFKDANLANIQKEPRFQKMVEALLNKTESKNKAEAATQTVPKTVSSQQAMVDGTNTLWEPRFEMLWSQFVFNDRKVAPATVQSFNDPAAKKLNTLFQRGLAAGNNGDLYDNRDRDHSKLTEKQYPQLAHVRYSPVAAKLNTDYGFNTRILFDAPTLGNSSTAVTSGAFWRSHSRLGYTTPGGAQKLYLQHVRNHLYVYPAVKDYSDTEDLLPANTPFLITTIGKSGSDKPYLRAVASILAAFKPEVKERLAKDGQLMSAVQMILRKNLKTVKKPEHYFSTKAHPIAFAADQLQLEKMIEHANGLNMGDYPGLPLLKVNSENKPIAGIDNFVGQMPEPLFTTPSSLSRVIRSSAFEKTINIETTASRSDQKGDVTFRWVILRGNPEKISINSEDDGAKAEIKVQWHTRKDLTIKGHYSGRVEIAVFADNGKEVSAPAILNFYYPPYQERVYDPSGNLLSIDHREPAGSYSDPQLFVKRDWKDSFRYDEKNRLIGWTRVSGDEKTEFTYHGAKIISKDNLGRALKAEQIGLLYNRDKKGRMVIEGEPLGRYLNYQYQNEKDLRGFLIN
ncbi:hypothetical protein GUA87_05990 [Sneathiella sp. P13V-1]|uniref:TPR end-of-group domain-containing protein n=1 Tax=Sneathiella sp. P13V-1 TaxID=2697366 RepID=UPI00187B5107|nr:hypothetical protein [Sneathiella sp. P13V-1]MBE7636388.1 hypothetical protein [Sneathiella sp. P13V-1]